MTELLYLADMDGAYARSFRATVVARPPGGVVLDRTLFYPFGGGQPADRGTLRVGGGAPVPVADVAKTAGTVVHRLGRGSGAAASALGVGVEVEGELDWARRHRHMRLHTVQHLVSARIFAATGRRTRRAVLGGTGATLELEAPWPAEADWRALAASVVAAVAAARPVRIRHVPRAEWERAPAARSGLVPLAPQVDPVRVIEIDGLDACPCGGTHVRSTAEIGAVDLPPPSGARVGVTLVEPDRPDPAG